MIQKYLKAFILFALGLFLATRLINDVILLYISERFVWLTLLAGVGLGIVALSYTVHLFWKNDDHDHNHDHHHHHHDHNCDHHEHDHDHHEHDHHDHAHVNLTWVGALIIAFPMVLGWIVPPEPLGAAALENREINFGATSTEVNETSQRPRDSIVVPPAAERTILEWMIAFEQRGVPTVINDGPADVMGFVYRDERFSEGTFMVSRYVVSCCVADATPVGLVVQWPNAAELEPDSWIQVSGSLTMGEFDGQPIPMLTADEIIAVETPTNPYLYELLAGQ